MADLLGVDREIPEIHKLYECHEHVLAHKRDLFNARFEMIMAWGEYGLIADFQPAECF